MTRPISQLRRRLFKTTLLVTLGAIIASAILNIVIDPYGTYRLVDIKGLNHIKPNPEHDIETIKAYHLRHVKPDALILGNSRAEVGFDPTHPIWQASGYKSVYNAAIRGSSTDTAWQLLNVAAQHQTPRLIVLGLDFFDFPIAPDYTPKPEGKNSAQPDTRWFFKSTLTMQALLDSAATLRRQYQTYPEQLTLLGHNPLLNYQEIAAAEGYWSLFRQRAEENAKNHGRKPNNLYLAGTQTSPRFEDIRRIVRWSIDHDAELKMVIYPYHAQLMLLIDELGFTPLYEEWQRQVLRIIEEESQGKPHRVTLTDFSGLSTFTQDQIPPKGDKKTATRWYWEAGHFKKQLGDQVLERILGVEKQSNTDAFGVMLTNKNIQPRNATQRQAMLTLKATHPEMTREIATLVGKAKPPQNAKTLNLALPKPNTP